MNGKAFALLFVVVAVGIGWFLMQKVTSEDTFQVKTAFGIPNEGTIELNVVATMGMTAKEAPRVDEKLQPKWDEWVQEHFFLTDAAGNSVPIGMRFSSDVIKPAQVMGTPEGYLVAKLKQGTAYQFDYKPKRAEAKRYRYSFTAPNGDVKAANHALKPV